MNIIGINSAYHESSVSLLIDGKQISFIEEERLNRIKHAKPSLIDNPNVLPLKALDLCMKQANLLVDDIDFFAFSFSESGRTQNSEIDTSTTPKSWGTAEGEKLFHQKLLSVPRDLSVFLNANIEEKFVWVDHHLAHAASAFLCSPHREAAILVVDGIGEFNAISAYTGSGTNIEKLFSIPYPNSLGFLWEKLCKYLGFSEYDAYKIMGLSAYGNPQVLKETFEHLISPSKTNFYSINNDIVNFRSNDYTKMEEILGPRRMPNEEITSHHKNIAAAMQMITEKYILEIGQYLYQATNLKNLCVAGGTALNCVANTLLLNKSGFQKVYIQPAANDAGTALGAALHLYNTTLKHGRACELIDAYYGPEYTNLEIEQAIENAGVSGNYLENPSELAAKYISEGHIVGWFQGRMEMGPRALGNRSLLADPRRKDMREILNVKIKHREEFRPFAPSVLTEFADEWFEMPNKSISTDFMLYTFPCKKSKASLIPAVVHVDGSSRIQTVSNETNPKYYNLISKFNEITGVPMVLNTSFNDQEPIVMSPDHALKTFLRTGIDFLFLGNYMISKQETRNKEQGTIMNNRIQDYVKPPKGSLFAPINGPRGKRLAIVFGNEGKDGKCPYHSSQCNHCDIGEGEGIQFSSELNTKRLDYFREYFSNDFKDIEHLVIYNYGSTLNESEMSLETLDYILKFVKETPTIKRISFDSREKFITPKLIKHICSSVNKDQIIAVTIGLESHSEIVRVKNLNKLITNQQVEDVFSSLAANKPQTAVDINVLFQAPGVVGSEAVNDACQTVEFGLSLMNKYNVPVDFNFHPYYPSIKGTNSFPDHPRAKLQDAIRALILIIRMIKGQEGDSRLFVGWNDEGHDLEPSLREKKLMLYDPAFATFNVGQNEKDLII